MMNYREEHDQMPQQQYGRKWLSLQNSSSLYGANKKNDDESFDGAMHKEDRHLLELILHDDAMEKSLMNDSNRSFLLMS